MLYKTDKNDINLSIHIKIERININNLKYVCIIVSIITMSLNETLKKNDKPLIDCRVKVILHLYYMVVERRFCYWNNFSLDYLRMMRLYLIKTLKRLLKHDNIG